VPGSDTIGLETGANLASFGLIDRDDSAHDYVPPPPSTELDVTTQLYQVRDATVRVAASAQRLLTICTTDMEPPVYDQPEFLQAAKALILGRSFGKIRVLVRDQGRMNSVNHRFISMARRLSHSIDIRVQPASMGKRPIAFCIADSGGIVYRARADRWDGVTAQQNPQAAQRLLDEFDKAWLEAESDMRQRTGYR
jgi:hypothetical protein